MSGPLSGVSVVELGGIGPVPYCGMLLADLGAEVVVVERIGSEPLSSLLHRGKRSIAVDLKREEGREVALRLAEAADALLEGFRPGVTEQLGLGPEECLARNPRLVYGRMTGWGQEGPLAGTAGHDIDYIALAGALHPIGLPDKPVPPLNLVGDFGGGAMFLAVGVLSALLHARRTGQGQVVDAAMVDGAAHLTTMFHGAIAEGWWNTLRQANLLDGGAPFYDTYETADGHHVAVGALEPQFYDTLLDALGVDRSELGDQMDREGWPFVRARLTDVFRSRTRDEWEEQLAGLDACAAPVLSLIEAPHHPHNLARGTFVEVEGVLQPAPAPRFSATPADPPSPPPSPGSDSRAMLEQLGYDPETVDRLLGSGAVDQPPRRSE